MKVFAAWTRLDATLQTPVIAEAAYSTDGGATWTKLALPGNVADPTGDPAAQGTPLPEATDASVGIDRNDQVYVVTSDHNADNTLGAIVLQKFNFQGSTPVQTITNKILYGWTDDAALYPTVAVDNTAASYVDSATGQTVNNPNSGNVYVAWTTNDGVTDQNNPSPNAIKIIASSDGGLSFTTRRNVSDNSALSLATAPRLTVSQGTADGRVKPGQVTLIWDDFGSAAPLDAIKSDRIAGAAGETFTSSGAIRDVVGSGQTVTNIPITVAINDPRMVTISDVDVRLALTAPDVSVLQVDLVAPDGRILPLIAPGDATGNSIGVGGGGAIYGATFDQEAARTFASATAPFAGQFQAVKQPPNSTTNFSLSDFYGKASKLAGGTWYLRITNPEGSGVGKVAEASLVFTSGLTAGNDSTVSFSTINGAIAAPYATIVLPNSDIGVAPAPVIAADNTLSSIGGHQGRIYAAYVDIFNPLYTPAAGALPNPADNTDIFLTWSDDGGVSWQNAFQNPSRLLNDDTNSSTDGFSEGFVDPNSFITGRPQFLPSLAVDPNTGTLAASFYDARQDAARSRAAMTITTSMDGGQTFSPQAMSFANTPNAPFDQITRTNVVVGPIPDNLSPGVPAAQRDPTFGFGDRQGLAFVNGQIVVVWSGNENGGPRGTNLLDIHAARAVTAAGPRVLDSTMGPVQAVTVNNVQFNNQTAPDGTPLIDGFVVRFDRQVNLTTFGTNDVQVFFRRPNQASGLMGSTVGVASIQPLDAVGNAASTFLVHLMAQPKWGVGTYAYAIGPDVRDFNGRPISSLVVDPTLHTYTAGTASSFTSADLPLAIPDNNPSGASTSITVDDLRADDTISGLEVTVSIAHPRPGDLQLFLDGPGGITVPLALNRGGSTANAYAGTIFTDNGAQPIGTATAPFVGTFQPETPLSAFIGKMADGVYTLRVVDTVAGQTGSITGFAVKVLTGASHSNTSGGLPDTGRSLAVLDVQDQPAAATIKAARVHVSIEHPSSGDLTLTLIAPDGTRIPLATNLGGTSANAYLNTTFDDAAGTAIGAASAPFTGSFKPQSPLSGLLGKAVNGQYRLELADSTGGSVGKVDTFTIDFDSSDAITMPTGAVPDLGVFNSRTTVTDFAPGAVISDLSVTISATHPRSGDLTIKLIAPDGTTVPLATKRGGNTANAYQGTIFTDSATRLIATATAPFIGTYKPESSLLTALAGKSPLGLWTVQVTDTVSGQSGSITGVTLTIGTKVLAANEASPVAVPDTGRIISGIAVAPAGTVASATVTVNLAHTNVSDVSLYLVAPDGTRVTLVDQNAAGGANYSITTFSDAAATAITAGTAPYNGSFKPQSPLSALVGKQAQGLWRLEVVDHKTGSTGTLNDWSLNVATDVAIASTDVPQAIPDNNPGGVSSSLGVFSLPPGTRVSNLEVTLSITHPADQELSAILIAPDGVTQVRLFNAAGAAPTGANFTNTTFSDAGAAISTGTAPYNSSVTPFTKFLPVDPLSTFNGLDASGVWTLKLVDSNGATPANIGTLTAWSLRLRTSASYGAAPATIADAATTDATLEVTDFPTSSVVDSLAVNVDIGRANIGDLALYLVGPDGTRVALSQYNGGTGSNYTGTTFSDAGTTDITSASAPFTGTFRPEEALAVFAGKSGAAINGIWRLEVVNIATGTPGTINGFSLDIRAASSYGKLPLPVPDPGQATAALNVTGLPATDVITDVDVTIGATHPNTADLQLTLIAPDGTRVPLVIGAPGMDFVGTIFDDQATLAITDPAAISPYTGRFQPSSPLSVLNGKAPNGVWRLEARDTVSGNVGTITDWSLAIRTVPQFAAAGLPAAIPDRNAGVGTATVTVTTPSPNDTVAGLAVDVSITHPRSSDLVLTLIGPDGTRVTLAKNNGAGANYTATTFSDAAATSITGGAAPFTGTFRPVQPLGTFNGRLAAGTWTLEAMDTVTGMVGTIDNFRLTVQTAAQASVLPLPIYDLSRSTSTIVVDNVAPTAVVADATVTLSIQHPHDADLTIYLVAPDGSRVLLARNVGGMNGADFTNTTFDDQALQAINANGVVAPFTGTFRPQGSLSGLIGRLATGNWTLEIVDEAAGVDPMTGQPILTEGTLLSWSLNLHTAAPNVVAAAGNQMDQNNNGVNGELLGDTYSAPRSLSGVPFQFPFDQTTQPLIVPGPHVVSTHVPGASQTVDNLVTDSTVSAIDVTFDRNMNGSTFTPSDITRLVTPLGVITGPFTVTQMDARTFRVGFPAQRISGTYSLVLGPDILSADGDAVDQNQNAGLDALRGVVDPQTGVTTQVTFTASANLPLTIAPNTTVFSTIDLTNAEDFLIQDVNVGLDITFPNDPDLTVRLVAVDPNGNPLGDIPVLLFSGVGSTGNKANFQNTVFDDQATTAIQDAGPPFFGRFTPQVGSGVALSGLNNQAASRLYRLEITNAGSQTGTLNSWSLEFRKPVPSTGLGEPVADRTPVSFRIFTMSLTNPQSSTSWTAVGPASTGAKGPGLNGETSGRVNAVAVDPSDPSGNTVYASGASGGIWKTANFLTTAATGPIWTPLTDFGPAFGMRVASITVVGRNNDPDQSIIFAVTGDGNALGDPAGPAALTARGVGMLRSLDGGKTWDLLDSTNNTVPLAQRDHIFSGGTGTAGYKIVADPKLTPTGDTIVYAALSDVTSAGTDTYNQLLTAAGLPIRGGLWRSVDSGKTWQQMKAGQATDVVLDPNSGTGAPGGNLQGLYAAFRNDGVYFSPNRGQVFTALPGVTGTPLIQNADGGQPQPVPAVGPPPPNFAGTQGSNRATPNSYTATSATTATAPAPAEPSLGRIVLAKPALTGDTLKDLLYQGFIYAAVQIHNEGDLVQFPPPLAVPSAFYGLFLSKDFGQTWTQVHLYQSAGNIPTNDDTTLFGSYDVTGSGTPGGSYYFKGNYDLSLAVDPVDPNVVYLGGTNMFQSSGLVRVDTTGIGDPHAFFLSNDDPDGGLLRTWANYTAVGGKLDTVNAAHSNLALASPTRGVTPGAPYDPVSEPQINLIRDPNNPFRAGATVLVNNAAVFYNTGDNARWTPFDVATQPDPFSTDPTDPWSRATRGQHQILTMIDPTTGRARLIFGNDDGIYTAVDDGNGSLLGSLGLNGGANSNGDVTVVNGSRNGNLQIAQFLAGAVQPSNLSAQLSSLKGMIFGNGTDTGQVNSVPDVVTPGSAGYGDISWSGANNGLSTRESGYGVATEQSYYTDPITGLPTARGLTYQFMTPEGLVERDFIGDGFHSSSDFFQVDTVARTFGLLQTSGGGDVADAQWPFRQGSPFAVNPINGDQILIGSAAGRVFRTENQGRIWSVVGIPSALDGTPANALAFGAPDPNGPGGVGNLDNFLYGGTTGNAALGIPGHIFVTQTGGGGAGSQWSNISDPLLGVRVNAAGQGQTVRYGLDGSEIKQIITNPTRGSHEAYAVTAGGWTVSQQDDQTPTNTGAVADGASGGKVITVSNDFGAFRIADLSVTMTITQSGNNVAPLRVQLVGPDGTTITLVNAVGDAMNGAGSAGGTAFTNTSFNDSSLVRIGPGTTGGVNTAVYRPVQDLSAFYNKELRGSWTLLVTDTVGGDTQTATISAFTLSATSLGGVYYNPNTLSSSSHWTPIDASLFGLQSTPFGTGNLQPAVRGLTSLVADWRYVIPDDVAFPNGPTHPILYAGGNGGVFRSTDKGLTWQAFPSADPGSLDTGVPDGGALPVAQVTDLDLSAGIIDPTTGQPNPGATLAGGTGVGPNILVASTYGRGSFAIRLAPQVFSQTLRLDDKLPNPPGATLGGSDSGNLGTTVGFGDKITNLVRPIISGNSQQSAFGNIITVNLLDLTPLTPGGPTRDPLTAPVIGTATTDAAGRFSIQVIAGYFKSDGTTDGAKILGVRGVDQAGSEGNVALFQFTLDTTPPATPDAPDLQALSDTGLSNTDNITRITDPTFDVQVIENLAAVELYRDGTLVARLVDVAPVSGVVAIQDPGTVSDGPHLYTVKQYDVAGNTSAMSASLTVTINTTPPPDPSVPDLLAADDTPVVGGLGYIAGVTDTDNVTSINTNLRFDVGNIEANATLELIRDGTTVTTIVGTSGGTVRIVDPGVVPDGAHQYKVRETDLAGNVVLISGSLAVVIDTIAPNAPSAPDLQSGDDTGVSNTDNITMTRNPHFDVATAEAQATLQLLRKVAGSSDSTYVVAASHTGPGTLQDTSNLADGVYTYATRQIDVAGNVSPLSLTTLNVTIDTIALAAPTSPDLEALSDTPFPGEQGYRAGISDVDNITRVTLFHPPIFDVTGEIDSTIFLVRDGTVVGQRTGPGPIADPNPPRIDGVYMYQSYQADPAGNISTLSPSLAVTIDTASPSAPSAPDLQPGSDDGVSNTDNITSITNPTFNLSGVEAGATVFLVRDGTVVQTAYDQTAGTITLQDAGPVSNGTHTYTAFQVDRAGNVSPLGGALQVTIDTSAPAAPTTPDLTDASDSGISNVDNITKVTAPVFSVSLVEVGATVQLLRKPFGAANSAYVIVGTRLNNGTVSDSGPVPDGVYQYASRQVDMAGNVGAISAPLTVTIDTTALAPNAPDLQAASDTGVSNTDNITSATVPVFDVAPAESGAKVELLRDGVVVGSRTGSGPIPDMGPVTEGTHLYTARQTDVAGNVSLIGAALAVQFVYTLPGAPNAPDLEAASDSPASGAPSYRAGVTDVDNITNAAAPVFDVTGALTGLKVELLRDGVVVGSRISSGPITDPGPITDGRHDYTVRQTDAAGNIGAVSSKLTVTFDASAPTPPTPPDLISADDSGSSNSDNITSVRNPHFTVATAEPTALVELLRKLNGAVDSTYVSIASRTGPGTLQDTSNLVSGVYTYAVRQTDVAGNVSSISGSLDVTIDTSTPTAPTAVTLQAASDTGRSSSDGITSKRTLVFDISGAKALAKVDLVRKAFNTSDSTYIVVATITVPAGNDPTVISLTDGGPLNDGRYVYATRQTLAAGGVSGYSTPTTVTVDTAAPAGINPRLVNDNGRPGDSTTTARQPQIGGTTEPGASVELLDDAGRTLAVASNAATDGSFSIAAPAQVHNGQYTYRLRATDAAGNVGPIGPALTVSLTSAIGDYNTDAKADLAVFNPPTAQWFIAQSGGLNQLTTFGAANTDVPISGDFDGDGKTDIAVYRPSTAQWFILQSTAGPLAVSFGAPGDIPVPADYDGDGKTDFAVYRPSTAQWFIRQSGGGARFQPFGQPGTDVPVPADYDGDGKVDIAVYRPSTGQWFIDRSTLGPVSYSFGAPNLDVPVPADYDGDGKADIAVFRPTTAQWLISQSTLGPRIQTQGQPGSIPVPADYDGDGKADLAVFNKSTAQWSLALSGGSAREQPFGVPGTSVPVLAPYSYRQAAAGGGGGGGIRVFGFADGGNGGASTSGLPGPATSASAPTTSSSAPVTSPAAAEPGRMARRLAALGAYRLRVRDGVHPAAGLRLPGGSAGHTLPAGLLARLRLLRLRDGRPS